jgi:hypothetical protein
MSVITYMGKVKASLARNGIKYTSPKAQEVLKSIEDGYLDGFQPGSEFHAGFAAALITLEEEAEKLRGATQPN